MTFPIPLDNLISYVRSLHPSGDPLEHLNDAVQVSARLDEQADALIGHGPWRGSLLAARRLCRCHPWGGSGYDPVR